MKQLFAAILCLCPLAGCGQLNSTGNTCRAEDEPTVRAEKAEPIGESSDHSGKTGLAPAGQGGGRFGGGVYPLPE